MDSQELKTFILYDVRPQANYQFVMIRTLLIVEHATKESIAKDLREANPQKTDTDFRQVPVYGVLVNRGIVKESDGMYTLVDFDKFNAEQKKELVLDCNRRIEEINEQKKITEPNYWKISPDEKASDWQRQKEKGIIAIGWRELGSLSGLNFEQIHEKIKNQYPSAVANISSQFKNFLNIKRGDIIVANKGKSKIVGIGKIKGDYQYLQGEKFPHSYSVDWFYTKEKEIPPQSNWFVTVLPISPELFKQIISGRNQKTKQSVDPELEELIIKFDQNPQEFDYEEWEWVDRQEREREHIEFLSKFPINEIENINIKNYVQGLKDASGNVQRNTFCYNLEHLARNSGSISGSTSDKFGIYFDKDAGKYQYKPTYTSSDEAFTAIKHQISVILETGKQFPNDKNWEKFSEIIDRPSDIQKHVRSKLLATYFPDTFLAIHSREKIDSLLDFFNIPKTKLRNNLTLKQSKLIEIKESHQIMKTWDMYKYSVFLWNVVLPRTVDKEEKEEGDEIIDYVTDKLPSVSLEELIDLKNVLGEEILIDDEKIEEIISALLIGKGVLLTGPVGTGKTNLATILPEIAWSKHGGYYSMVYTATADWTTQDVIGGIYPKVSEKNEIRYDIQNGCVTETVSLNWKDKTSESKIRESREFENRNGIKQKFRGVWLVIDEFNRANIDRAFGQLFTALEYNKLQKPTTEQNIPYEELKIPEDYRIIGTLNTADKHYLHSLSDALKRRFSIIDIPIPKYSRKDEELYFVAKKAISGLEYINVNLILSDDERKIFRGKGDQETENILDTLYTLMTILREIKPLGTALLISMFRLMIANHSLDLVKNKKWDNSLDSALVASIIPQIEDQPYWTLKVIQATFCNNIERFFVDDLEIKNGEIEKYKKDFQKIVNAVSKIKDQRIKKITKRFSEGIINDNDIEFLNVWKGENVGKKPSLPKFRNALDQLILEKGFDLESEEIEDES